MIKKKIAMYGGSFNPVHNGHIELTNLFINKLGLDFCLLIPTAVPPHKSNKEIISETHRLNMCKLAAQGLEKIAVSDIEIKRKGKSYTVDTLNQLKNIYPESEFYLLMGADMFLSLETWKNINEIFSLATICTIPRADDNFSQLLEYGERLKKIGAKVCILDFTVMQVSSTVIRQKIKNGDDIKKLVPKRVEEYIYDNNLYKE